jgi:energy-coupling factor transport system permease protein
VDNRFVINFSPGGTLLHRLNGATKVLLFITLTVLIIATFDIRIHVPVFFACLAGIVSMRPNWKPLIFMFGFLVIVVGLWGSFLLFLVVPHAGLNNIGQETVIARLSDRYYLSVEFFWYAFFMFFKRMTSFMSVMLFILSITPSELAAGLNFLRLPYKICLIIALGFRTIPGVARDYMAVSQAMQMRGVEMSSRRVSVFTRLKQTVLMVVPLVFTAFGKVENIANAMDLRGFGKNKRRSWYSEHEPTRMDYIFRVFIGLMAAFTLFYIVYFRILNPWPFTYWYWGLTL